MENFLLYSLFLLPKVSPSSSWRLASASMHSREFWLWPFLSVTQWRPFSSSRFTPALSNSLSPSHGLPSLLTFFLSAPVQDLRLIFRSLLSLSPHCFFPLLLFLFLLGSLLLFLLPLQLTKKENLRQFCLFFLSIFSSLSPISISVL